ncbi:hypothetical protein BHM03_00044023 [Ensete ventricosum]|nr:hypothetical protein BHM03_00044023 [Ensete ventricosum]
MMKVGGLLKQQLITVLIDTTSTNNFTNSEVAAQLMLQNEDYSGLDVEVADGQILKYDERCPRVKLLRQDQEILAYFFHLPLDDYKAVLDIKWLTTLGDVPWNFSKFIMKIFSHEKQEILHRKRRSDLMIAWDHGNATHHRPVTTGDVGLQEQDVPTIGPRGTLMRNCISRPKDMELNLEDKADLKRRVC